MKTKEQVCNKGLLEFWQKKTDPRRIYRKYVKD